MSSKVIINGRFLTQQITGVQRYAREMVAALDEIDSPDISFELICPPGAEHLTALKRIQQSFHGSRGGHYWEQFELPKAARGWPLINLCNMGPLLCRKQAVVIHDAAVFDAPHGYTWAYLTWYRMAQRILVWRGTKIITVSEFSRRQLSKALGCSESDVSVIGCAVDHMGRVASDEAILERLNLRGQRFLLSVGSKNPNKNIASLIESMRLPGLTDIPLVLAGGSHTLVFGAGQVQELPSNVIYSGYVTDEELVALFRHALVFVFPSLYEGFGLPPLEAMQQGCPVAASTAASIPEVCGPDAAVYFDAEKPQEIASVLNQLMVDDMKRQRLAQVGHERTNEFLWSRQAEKLLALVRSRLVS